MGDLSSHNISRDHTISEAEIPLHALAAAEDLTTQCYFLCLFLAPLCLHRPHSTFSTQCSVPVHGLLSSSNILSPLHVQDSTLGIWTFSGVLAPVLVLALACLYKAPYSAWLSAQFPPRSFRISLSPSLLISWLRGVKIRRCARAWPCCAT